MSAAVPAVPAVPADEPTDLLVVIPHMGAGGAQRVASLLTHHWQERGVRIAIITLFPEPDAHRLHAEIRREHFSTEGGLLARLYFGAQGWLNGGLRGNAILRPLARLGLVGLEGVRWARAFTRTHFFAERSALRSERVQRLRGRLADSHPRMVLSFLGATNIQTLLAARGLGVKVVISERNDPAIQRLDAPWERLRPRIYPEADLVTANSAGALRTMSRYVPAEKLRQVANPLVIPPCPSGIERRARRLISVARLVHQKGCDLLLDAFARIAPKAPEWMLDIVGDGPLRAELEQQAERLGIARQVVFHGHQRDPFPLLYGASVFVLASRFEGLPNAMLEAMGCGLAVVVTDASPGPLELIRDGETGLVCPAEDAGTLAEAMTRLIEDAPLRGRLAQAAQSEAAKMDLPLVAGRWEALFRELGVDLVRSVAS
jgi:glycosyltransferase involved in cell wall biosynthesis